MTNKEKLKKLLQVAVDNKWEDDNDLLDEFKFITTSVYNNNIYIGKLIIL